MLVPKRADLVKALVLLLCFVPAVNLVVLLQRLNEHFIRAYDFRVFSLAIGETGAWAFIFLFIALSCTPIQRLTGLRWAGELRRTLGLVAFFWCLLHLTAYLLIGQKLNFAYAWIDAVNQRSRLPGWAAVILLLPLAVTSTDGMVRRIGGKRWKLLHRLVYPATALAIWHLAWTDSEYSRDDHRAKNVLIPFVILMALRLVPRKMWRKSRANG